MSSASTRFLASPLALCLGLWAALASPLAAQTPYYWVYENHPEANYTEIWNQNGYLTRFYDGDHVGTDPFMSSRIDYRGTVHLNGTAAPIYNQTVYSFCATSYHGWAIVEGSHATGNIYRYGPDESGFGPWSWHPTQGIALYLDADHDHEVVHSNLDGDVWALAPGKGWVRIFYGSPAEHARDVAVHMGTYYITTREGKVKTTQIPRNELYLYGGRRPRRAVWSEDMAFTALGKKAQNLGISHARGVEPILAVTAEVDSQNNEVYVKLPDRGYTFLNASGPLGARDVSVTTGNVEDQ